ncbi:MAG TPA: primary-amine oxidase [Candidatus Acidoferrales bacterium]|nr:primary-amine oxidase [Candidatus Acidoferrales bacterium]
MALALLIYTGCRTVPPITHPLAPLTASEIRGAVRILKASGRVPPGARFSLVALDEPPKELVLRQVGIPRRAFAVVYDDAANKTWEALADLEAARVDQWKEIPRAEPPVSAEDSGLADRIVRNDSRWQQSLRARGVDAGSVIVVAWSAGYFALPGAGEGRIVRAIPYLGEGKNFYAHPIEGLVAHVNLTTGRIIDLLDTGRNIPVPRESGELSMPAAGAPRLAPAPLDILQPHGPGFQIEDGEVRWQKWRFRYGLHPREGLVLYTVGYEDGGRVRPILYRASLSEMMVPYGDPGGGWFFRNSFDAGELGLGVNASPLKPGVDCPANCSVFDAVFAGGNGEPVTIPHAVALYERDGGLAWKHDDEARRARDLVLSFVATVGNYDYGFDWIFHQDGALEMRVALTGVMAAKAVAEGAHDGFSHRVSKNLAAPHHQHFFTFRLDLDVDGAMPNRVVEMNSVAVPPGARNPYGGAFTMEETPLLTERQAQRNLDLAGSRKWIVINPNVMNALGHPTGYALLPGENALLLAQPDSWVRKRAGFLNSHVWVTPYRSAEIYAGGDYPNQSPGGDGLVKWTADNRPIDNHDVVLWYSMGITHNPRPEDWPVMPVHAAGFRLVPWGFFARNPALDLP